MARVLLFHYREAKRGKAVLQALERAGHHVVDAAPDYPDFKTSLEVADPDVVVADCTMRFSHAIEAADYVASLAKYAGIPVLLTNLDPGNEGYARIKLAHARIVESDAVAAAVDAALG